eukprot:scaffold155883_cov28-Tisochrysis_lutea.AAC.2
MASALLGALLGAPPTTVHVDASAITHRLSHLHLGCHFDAGESEGGDGSTREGREGGERKCE